MERKLRFDFAKLKAKGQLRSAFMPQNEERPSRYFSASVDRTTMDRSRTEAIDPPNPTFSGGKRRLTRVDPELGAQKRQRRTGNLAEEVPRTPKSFQKRGTLATSPDTGIDPHDDVALKVSPHETEGSPAHQAAREGAEISAEAFDALRHEVQLLREVLARVESSFEAVRDRLSTLERQQPRLEGQLDILVRMQQSAARPPVSAQAPSSPRGKGPDMA